MGSSQLDIHICLLLKHEQLQEEMMANNMDIFELGYLCPWGSLSDDLNLPLSHCQEKAAASWEMLLIISDYVDHWHLFA